MSINISFGSIIYIRVGSFIYNDTINKEKELILGCDGFLTNQILINNL